MSTLEGKRILVVEDDHRAGAALCAELKMLGAVVLGPAPTSYYAMSLLGSRRVDAALLDVDLHGAKVFPFVAYLETLNVPIALATAPGAEPVPERYRALPAITKPYAIETVLDVLSSLVRSNDKKSIPIATPTEAAREADGYRMERAVAGALRKQPRRTIFSHGG